MFDAAPAALLVSGAATEPDIRRTHSGLIGAFGNYLGITGNTQNRGQNERSWCGNPISA